MSILRDGHNNRDEFVQQNATDIKQSTVTVRAANAAANEAL
ncbi:hypothetical protein VD0002_g6554 [Verticillium dahliae]|nr:hypothetical protein VD0004_g3750 [Verticillium dahliae]PNH61204.1 hypothetical protein VD0002_g6554 [Verticillium dahliae]PNH73851.1 hypothetical protein VD0001_g3709 [Verticillium dahliae]